MRWLSSYTGVFTTKPESLRLISTFYKLIFIGCALSSTSVLQNTYTHTHMERQKERERERERERETGIIQTLNYKTLKRTREKNETNFST